MEQWQTNTTHATNTPSIIDYISIINMKYNWNDDMPIGSSIYDWNLIEFMNSNDISGLSIGWGLICV